MASADISLRHIARRWAADLARGLVPAGTDVEVLGWLDSQLTATERRLDKALLLRIARRRRALHVEFEVDPDRELPERVVEYQSLLFFALRARSKRRVPPIKSVVVVLRGRAEPHPPGGKRRIGWPEDPWSGARYQLEPVYQRSVGELRARGGLLWLAFTPLARDATAGAMRSVLAEIRAAVPAVQERAEIYAAMAALADLKPWGYSLRREIRDMLRLTDDAVFRESEILQEAFAEGIEQGIEKGRDEGIAASVERTLRRLLLKKSGRSLTRAEQNALAKRAHETSPEQLADLAMLPGDALLDWLLRK